jgi:hypothetical protein
LPFFPSSISHFSSSDSISLAFPKDFANLILDSLAFAFPSKFSATKI